MTVPPEIRAAAEQRSAARAARDWPTADRLKAEIEAAGWKVIDAGTSFRLEPAHAPDVIEGDIVRYGRVESVPSRLDEPDTAVASVVIVAGDEPGEVARAVRGIEAGGRSDTTIVIVADAPEADVEASLDALVADRGHELVRTSAQLGYAAAVQIGLRRATGRVVLILDPSIEPTGDLVDPLVAALEDPGVAVVGPFGLVSADLRRYDQVADGDAVAVEGYAMAFRRADARDRGPLDPHFRFYRNADIWWSLVLRDEGEERPPRRALAVPGLPLVRHEHRGPTSVAPAERDRLSKRNFYRILDRFGHRRDLAVPGVRPTEGATSGSSVARSGGGNTAGR